MPRGSIPGRERRYEHIEDNAPDRVCAGARRRGVHGRSSTDKAELKKVLGE
ncbi:MULTISPECIES: hypothetical protein [unclassified Streptomyces]|uniref:hypothetical protein n=1 Tax=unclassified Streptomyces TaxID=2593676 RepID=UPI0033A6D581